MKKLIIGLLVMTGFLLSAFNADARVDGYLTNGLPEGTMTVYGHSNKQIPCSINNGGNEKRSKVFLPLETCYIKIQTFPIILRIEADQPSRTGLAVFVLEDRNADSSRPQKITVKREVDINLYNRKIRTRGSRRISGGHQGTMKLNWFTVTDILHLTLVEEDFTWIPKQTGTQEEIKIEK